MLKYAYFMHTNMAVRKPDTSEGFAPRVDVGEALALPANNCLRLDGRLDAGLLSPSLHQTLLDLAGSTTS